MRSKSRAAIQSGINSRGDGAAECGAPALRARTVAGKSTGLVQAAREAIAPAFCSVCCAERKGLTPFSEKSGGATGVTRTVWKCVDCCSLGELAELAQHEIQEHGASGRPAKSKGGGAR
jgi:hypothetical protein